MKRILAVVFLVLIVGALLVQVVEAIDPGKSSTAKSNTTAVQTLPAAAYADTALGTTVDLLGYRVAMIVVNVGDWTDGTHTMKLEESDYSDTLFALTSDRAGSTPTVSSESNDDQSYMFTYTGSKRYIRVSTYVASGSTGAVYGASVLRMEP